MNWEIPEDSVLFKHFYILGIGGNSILRKARLLTHTDLHRRTHVHSYAYKFDSYWCGLLN